MSIQRWDPWRDIVTLREAMNSLLEESFVRPRAGMTAMTSGMAMDLRESENSFIVETVLPGVRPEDVDVSIQNDTLRISAEAKEETAKGEEGQEQEKWLMRERRYGRFERTVTLPSSVNVDQANAEFENGILRITLPKSEEQRPRQIQVRPAQEIAVDEVHG